MSVLIIKNVITEGPGTIEYFLSTNNIPFNIVELGSGEIPPSIERFNTLVILGGPPGVYEMDEFPHIMVGTRLIREAINRELWVLGICLGAQMIAHCLGAKVYKGPKEEIGWYRIELTGDGLRDPLMRRLATHPRIGDFWRNFEVFHWHGDTFDIPHEAVLLAKSKQYKSQAFRYRNTIYGFQFHIEITKDMVFEWFKDMPYRDQLTKETEDIYEEYAGRAMNFYKAFFLRR